jgi:hypothetical protein
MAHKAKLGEVADVCGVAVLHSCSLWREGPDVNYTNSRVQAPAVVAPRRPVLEVSILKASVRYPGKQGRERKRSDARRNARKISLAKLVR